MISQINSWDEQLVLCVNAQHNGFLDQLMWGLSSKWLILPILIGLIFILLKQQRNGKEIGMLLLFGTLMVIACDVISTQLFKEVFHRLRPSHNLVIAEQLHYHLFSDGSPYLGGKYGFVSSHAANFAGFAVFFWPFFVKSWMKSVIVSIVLLVMYSRMYLGVHYFTDVFVGALLGMFIAYVMRRYVLSRFVKITKE
jgi:undecaprenyl-diphosphatase